MTLPNWWVRGLVVSLGMVLERRWAQLEWEGVNTGQHKDAPDG